MKNRDKGSKSRQRIFGVKQAVVLLSLFFLLAPGNGWGGQSISTQDGAASDQSLRNEVGHAVERGLQWLVQAQNPKGYWSQPEYPALTALVLTGFMGDPGDRYTKAPPPFIRKGYDFILASVRPDGGIYGRGLANYNTAVCMMALQMARNTAYQPVLIKARRFLQGLQADFDEKGKTDNPYDGGIGYGGRYDHSDMSNTMFALEALYYTRYLNRDTAKEGFKGLNWEAAVRFIERCQNLPQYNDQPWVSDDPRNRGGFVYFPGKSQAGEEILPSGKKALRSYGSMSYAGLLSYIYARLDRDDPRVKAVFDWLSRNYTLDENPGMGKQGLFYYYHTMAKALSIHGTDKLELANGKKVDWRKDLALRLLNLQARDGSWINENGRWWERDPVLVTAYALIALEIIYRGL